MILNLKIVIKEFLDLLNILKAQILCIHKFMEVFIVYKYQNFIFIVFYIVVTSFKNLNNG